MNKVNAFCIAAGILFSGCAYTHPPRCYEGYVTETERVNVGEDSVYRVFLSSGEAFNNTDDLTIGKFNSASLQAQLSNAEKNNQWVYISAYGIRSEVASIFPNIKEFSTVSCPQ